MISDNGSALLNDVGLNACIFKATYSDVTPIPAGWPFKAPEELLHDYEPAAFMHTKAMDVYAFASTMYTVSSCCLLKFMNFIGPVDTLFADRYLPSKHPYPPQPYGGGIMRIMSQGHALERSTKITDALWDLIQRCRSYRPEDRPLIAAVEGALVTM